MRDLWEDGQDDGSAELRHTDWCRELTKEQIPKGLYVPGCPPGPAFIIVSPCFQISHDSDTATPWTGPVLGFLERVHVSFQ